MGRLVHLAGDCEARRKHCDSWCPWETSHAEFRANVVSQFQDDCRYGSWILDSRTHASRGRWHLTFRQVDQPPLEAFRDRRCLQAFQFAQRRCFEDVAHERWTERDAFANQVCVVKMTALLDEQLRIVQ